MSPTDRHKVADTGRSSPFEEPSDAPELRSERSENLYTRSDAFWEPVVHVPQEGEKVKRSDRYWDHPEVMEEAGRMTVPERNPWKKVLRLLGSSTAKRLVIVVAVLCVVAFILNSALMQVHEIQVVGNTTVPAEEVIRLSGIRRGDSTWNINEKDVMTRIQANRTLRCILVDVELDKVTLHIKERVPAAYTDTAGMRVIMDNRGFVLAESYDTSQDMSHLTLVDGLDVRRHTPGLTIILNKENQLTLYQQLLIELKAMGHENLLATVDMSDMDSIILTTRDGLTVRMGDEQQVHQKLRAFLIVRDKLAEMGLGSGLVDVTTPGRPTFLPTAAPEDAVEAAYEDQ